VRGSVRGCIGLRRVYRGEADCSFAKRRACRGVSRIVTAGYGSASGTSPTICSSHVGSGVGRLQSWSEILAEPVLDFCGVGEDEIALDVGCGLGSLARAALGRTDTTVVIGIDRRHEAVAAARLRASSQRAAFNVVGDARQMPIATVPSIAASLC
jgi:2-polyprenyl-3-methyl-5-hydroxy-6-metoxy-1,4-benzoquinol methylase